MCTLDVIGLLYKLIEAGIERQKYKENITNKLMDSKIVTYF